ncbi:MAG: Gfo/Idh/MocA family oxidoreductase [Clostridia bacterium]|nr:Gfo/Idh/MocA family oxidoreductase [Clostridia bacterium]
MIRVGIVGTGGISRSHLEGYRDIPGATLVAACDVQGEGAKNHDLALSLGAKFYTDLEDMLASEELDMLDVCLPTPLHASAVLAGFAHGLHVLSEKPMCRTSLECESVIEAARLSGKKYMVAHVVRFMKPYRYLASVIKSGELGAPVEIMMRRLSHVPEWSYQNWMQDASLSGGSPLDLSIHDLDFLYSILGEPDTASAVYRSFSGADERGRNDLITSSLTWGKISATVIGAQYNADIPFTADFLAVFERGTVELKGGKVYKSGEEVELDEEVAKEGSSGINISSSGAYTDEIAYFIDCIINDRAPEEVLPESSLGSVRLVERLLASATKI